MEENIVVSVIIPVYNAERYIKRMLDSVLNQTFQSFEIIVIDDGSRDGTGEILKLYSEKNTKIRYIKTENRGPSSARNIGIENAKGKWVQFLDADDFIDSNLFQEFHDKAEENIDLLFSGIIKNYSNLEILVPMQLNLSIGRENVSAFIETMDSETQNVLMNYVWNKWYRKELIDKNKLSFDENVCSGEDFLFNCAYLKCLNSFMALPGCYYHYCANDGDSLVVQFRKNAKEIQDNQNAVYLDMLGSFALEDCLKQKTDIYFGRCYYSALTRIGLNLDKVAKADAREYVESFLEDNCINYIETYFKNLPLLRFIKLFPVWITLKKKNVNGVLNMIWLRYHVQREQNRR